MRCEKSWAWIKKNTCARFFSTICRSFGRGEDNPPLCLSVILAIFLLRSFRTRAPNFFSFSLSGRGVGKLFPNSSVSRIIRILNNAPVSTNPSRHNRFQIRDPLNLKVRLSLFAEWQTRTRALVHLRFSGGGGDEREKGEGEEFGLWWRIYRRNLWLR